MTLVDLQQELTEKYNIIEEDWPNWADLETEVVYSNGEPVVIHLVPDSDEFVKLFIANQGEFHYTEDVEVTCDYEEIHDAIYEMLETLELD